MDNSVDNLWITPVDKLWTNCGYPVDKWGAGLKCFAQVYKVRLMFTKEAN